MSLSKSVQICEICRKESGIYSCPRCSRKYCSSACYKSPDHGLCSESFYQEWVESSLQNETFDEKEKGDMLQILKRCYEESTTENDLSNEPQIDERFDGLNIEEADERTLWKKLSKQERAKFKSLMEDDSKLEEIVLLKQPWWLEKSLNLVRDLDEEESVSNNVSSRPFFPLNVKELAQLSTKQPSDCLKFNLVNIIYAYAFLYRFYNCDFKDFLEDVVESFLIISPVLSCNKSYQSFEESVQDTIRLILSLDLKVSLDFVKSIVNDVNSILHGPNNAKPSTFVLCALNDIKARFLDFKTSKDISKGVKKLIMPAVKKIEYFMSWSLDFECSLKVVASDLLLIMMPDLVIQPIDSEDNISKVTNKTPVIEEIC